jgi:hypothetical protein
MQDLALFVSILLLILIIFGPIAILIARIKTQSLFLLILKRIFQFLFISVGTFVGLIFVTNRSLPFLLRVLGLITISLCYIALRNEYFPNFKILERLGIQRKNNSEHGPVLKWRKRGSSSGKDGHGPEGQH